MKAEIHPKTYDVVFVDTSSGAQFISQSTTKTDETIKIGSKEYYVIKVEISSSTHPFFTGKQKLIDSSGRVDKFMAKMKKAQELSETKVKKVKKGKEEDIAKETTEKTTKKSAPKAKKKEE